jgi:hypothetical protein
MYLVEDVLAAIDNFLEVSFLLVIELRQDDIYVLENNRKVSDPVNSGS